MAQSSEKLAKRRRELLARCAEQRRTMVIHNHSLSESMSKVDHALAFVGRIRQHPGVIAALAAIAVVALRPRRMATLLSTSALALRTLRAARTFAPMLQGLRARY